MRPGKVLKIVCALSVTVSAAMAGETQKQIIERSLRGAGVSEANARQVSEVSDVALEAVREYARSAVPKPGTPRTSTPNPVGPIVTLAFNLDTISCAATLVIIRNAQRDLVFRLTREYRDATRAEADLLGKLQKMHDALYIACNPHEQTKPVASTPRTGDAADDTADDDDTTGTAFVIPDDWTLEDYDCFRACATPHLNYTRRAEHMLPSMERAIREAGAKLGRINKRSVAAYEAGQSDCEALNRPARKQLKKLLALYQQARENIGALDRYYQRMVVACVKRCPIKVQIARARGYPETPDHVRIRLGLLFVKPEYFQGGACPGAGLPLPRPLAPAIAQPVSPLPVPLPSVGD